MLIILFALHANLQYKLSRPWIDTKFARPGHLECDNRWWTYNICGTV